MRKWNLLLAATTLSTVTLFTTSEAVHSGSSKQQEEMARTLTKIDYKTSPVAIVKAGLEMQPIEFDQPFLATDNWLVQLKFDVENVSEHNIIYIQLELQVSTINTEDKVRVAYPIEIGENPQLPGKVATLNLKPGHRATGWRVRAAEYRSYLNQVRQTRGYEIDRAHAQISVDEVMLDNDTLWKRDRTYVRSLEDPSKWIDPTALRRQSSQSTNSKMPAGPPKLLAIGFSVPARDPRCDYTRLAGLYNLACGSNPSCLARQVPQYEFETGHDGCGDSKRGAGSFDIVYPCTDPADATCGTATEPYFEPCQVINARPEGGCGSCNDGNCEQDNDCQQGQNCVNRCCIPSSPILIDVLGDGFHLSDAGHGVNFDLYGDGRLRKLSWTSLDSDDGWLALDRNGDGIINNGKELFGNVTDQPATPGKKPNGFLALAEFDKARKGGNGDGQIDRRDAVFRSLRIWQDTNHNGISEPNEIYPLSEVNLAIIDLDYKETPRVDQFGNQFRYRAKVQDVNGAQIGRWAWDVFLVPAR